MYQRSHTKMDVSPCNKLETSWWKKCKSSSTLFMDHTDIRILLGVSCIKRQASWFNIICTLFMYPLRKWLFCFLPKCFLKSEIDSSPHLESHILFHSCGTYILKHQYNHKGWIIYNKSSYILWFFCIWLMQCNTLKIHDYWYQSGVGNVENEV